LPAARTIARALAVALPLILLDALGVARLTDPIAPALQLAALVLFALWWTGLVRGGTGPATSPLVLLLGYLAVVALAAAFSVSPRLSLDRLLWTSALVLFLFLCSDRMCRGWGTGPFVAGLALLGAYYLALSLAEVARWHLGWAAVRVPGYPLFPRSYRLGGVAENVNFLAGMLALLLPFAIVRLAGARSLLRRAGWGLYLAALVTVTFFTRSRGGWMASAVGAALTVGWLVYRRAGLPWATGWWPWWRASRRLWMVAAAYAGLFAGLYLLTWAITPPAGRLVRGDFTTGRTELWRTALAAFAERPLLGTGPGTYTFVRTDMSPDSRLGVSMHAHNLALEVLSQEGLLGALALAVALVVGARACLRALWRSLPAIDEPVLLAAVAALAGWLAHSLVDVTAWLPVIALSVTLIAALALYAAGEVRPGRPLPRGAMAGLLVPLALVPLLLHQNRGRAALQDALLAGRRGDWVQAAPAADRALAADPGLALYWGQSALAWGMAAEETGDPAYRERSLARYREALEREPAYVPNLLNAAVLLAGAGEGARAEALLEEAARHSRTWALPHLLLAEHRAARGDEEGAAAAYRAAFQSELDAPEMVACRRSPACRQAALAYEDPDEMAHHAARTWLAQGRPEEALALLDPAPFAEADARAWIYRLHAHSLTGDLVHARYEARMVETLDLLGRPTYAADAGLALAAYHLAEGRPGDAIAALEEALRPVGSPTSLAYAYRAYGRLPLPALLLPSVELLQSTPSHLEAYRVLARLYAESGRSEDARWASARAEALAAAL
jgi:O-antigen ligase